MREIRPVHLGWQHVEPSDLYPAGIAPRFVQVTVWSDSGRVELPDGLTPDEADFARRCVAHDKARNVEGSSLELAGRFFPEGSWRPAELAGLDVTT